VPSALFQVPIPLPRAFRDERGENEQGNACDNNPNQYFYKHHCYHGLLKELQKYEIF
jgi:hypothetical protein